MWRLKVFGKVLNGTRLTVDSWIKVLLSAIILLGVGMSASLVFAIVAVTDNTKHIKELNTLHEASCIEKRDLRADIKNTQRFLDSTDADMIFGIPREVLEDSKDQNQDKLDSLKIVDCTDD